MYVTEVDMGNSIIQLLILAFVAIFLILRLKNILGTRDGFERKPDDVSSVRKVSAKANPNLEIIDGGLDQDITDHVKAGSKLAITLSEIKSADIDFAVTEFLSGARNAYEMILLAFKKGDISKINKFISNDVQNAFSKDIERRKSEGLHSEAIFGGIRELTILDAEFDNKNLDVEITVRFLSDLTIIVKNASGKIIEGSQTDIKLQKDIWTFKRTLSSNSPIWILIATEA